jgi:ketosteroid isomerase-like protein
MSVDGHRLRAAEANLELAREIAATFGRTDPDAAQRLFHPDLEFHDAWAVGAGLYHGLSGMRQLYQDFAAAWEEFSFEPLQLEPTPDGRVFMTARQRVKRKTTSREIERTMYFVLAFRDGKLVTWDGWHLEAGARTAAGLSN